MASRLNEYFGREALEYLEGIEELFAASNDPDPAEVLRLIAGVRGTIRMAGAREVAALAEQVEEEVAAGRARAAPWGAGVRDLVVHTVAELKHLVQLLDDWGGEEERRLHGAMSRWADHRSRPIPVTELFYDDAGPHIVAEGADEDLPIVPVSTLLFDGADALREALALRPRIEAALHLEARTPAEGAALLEELFDLIELGLPPETNAG